jgi:hypothetical protein
MVMQQEMDFLSFKEMTRMNGNFGGGNGGTGNPSGIEGSGYIESDSGPYKIPDSERNEMKKNGMTPEYGMRITPRSGVADCLNNINTFGGSAVGIFGGNYGFSSYQKFKYAEGIGERVASSSVITRLNAFQSLKVNRILGVVGKYSGIAGTIYSGSKVFSQYLKGGFKEINHWDAYDTGAGAVGVSASVFLAASNPIGWGIGIGVGVYFGARLVYDLSN